jgi:uncharacterized protein
MKRFLNTLFLITTILVSNIYSFSQAILGDSTIKAPINKTADDIAREAFAVGKVGIRARYINTPNKIMLHYAPLDNATFELGKLYGYKITRFEIAANGSEINGTTPIIVKAKTLSEWQLKKDDDYYDLVYDALNLDPLDPNTLIPDNKVYIDPSTKVLNDNIQNNNAIYGMAMFGASVSYGAATYGGLTFEDNTVIAGKKYRYRILARISNTDNSSLKKTRKLNKNEIISEGIEYVDILSTYTEYPDISTPKIKVDKAVAKKVELAWKYKINLDNSATNNLQKYFSSFHIERKPSTEVTYQRITTQPIVKFVSESDSLFYVDTTVTNKTAIYDYRLVGVTYFDEVRNSEPTRIDINQIYDVAPAIDYFKNSPSNLLNYKLDWHFDNIRTGMQTTFPVAEIANYQLWVSNNDKTYSNSGAIIAKTGLTMDIPKSIFNSSLVDSTKTMYLKLILTTNSTDKIESFSYIKIPAVRVGPAKPTGFTAVGTIVGDKYIISLNWQKLIVGNDPLKYQIFRNIGNETERYDVSKGINYYEQPMVVSDILLKDMSYPEITYTLIAYDTYFNPSESAIVKITKPDLFTPFPPTIKSFQVNNLDVTLNFEIKVEPDTKEFVLRRGTSETDMVDILVFTPNSLISTYLDKNLLNNSTYKYTIYARDNSGNVSCFNKAENLCFQIVSVKVLSTKKPQVNGFKAVLNLDYPSVTLSWIGLNDPDIESYELYKRYIYRLNTADNSSLSFWKNLTSFDITTPDFDVKYTNTYQYGIKAFYKDGTTSPIISLSVFIPNKEACGTGQLVIENSTILPANTIKNDKACFEIRLKDGFSAKASTGVQYKGEITGN